MHGKARHWDSLPKLSVNELHLVKSKFRGYDLIQ